MAPHSAIPTNGNGDGNHPHTHAPHTSHDLSADVSVNVDVNPIAALRSKLDHESDADPQRTRTRTGAIGATETGHQNDEMTSDELQEAEEAEEAGHALQMKRTDEEKIRLRLLALFAYFPRLTHSMVQTGLGIQFPVARWQPVIAKMVDDKVLLISSQQVTTPAGRWKTIRIYHLPGDDLKPFKLKEPVPNLDA
jgi:hypothetical protein